MGENESQKKVKERRGNKLRKIVEAENKTGINFEYFVSRLVI
jgi:hypothetical protein